MRGKPLNVFDCELDGINLIEASAGTGKTWNICGLYLRLLLERGLEVQQILVVTFTNAATAELRERIRSRIVDTLSRLRGTGPACGDAFVDALLASLRGKHHLADADMVLRLDLALQTFDEAAIFTIHGFCQRALADTPFTAGAPMSLELLTDDSALRMEIVHDFWRNHVAGDALHASLAQHLLSGRDSPRRWATLLARQSAKPLSRIIWPAALDLASGPESMALVQAHTRARATWHAERETIVACVTEALPRLSANVYKPNTVDLAAASWDQQLQSRNPLNAPGRLDKLALFTTDRLKPKKGHAPPRAHRFFEQAGDLLRQLEDAKQSLSIDRQRLLRRLLGDAPPRLRSLKRERRVVAFDDMLFNLYDSLCSGRQPWLAAALKARFPAALIDEFQDTDPLQFAIFKTIYGDGATPLFLVGDPKQAIYSFRNADLHTYLQARGEAAAEHTLADNQRSTRELLCALNGLFSLNPRAFVLPGLDYRPVNLGAKPRAAWHDATTTRGAAMQLWELPQDEAGRPLQKKAARQAAVRATASEIARLLNGAQHGDVLLGGQPLGGGDIAVLVRSHAQGNEIKRALDALGVGSIELSQASVFQSPDAEDLERVMAAIQQPGKDRLLRAALATEMFGFDAAGIDALSNDEARLLGFIDRFLDYRDLWLQRGAGAMLRSLMVREGVDARLLARPDGERRLTNLLHLAECLHEAAEQHGSPDLLLRWLQTARADDSTHEAAQLRLESDRNLVQIVTVHKSKGLEYPVVFCPFLWDGHPGSPRTLEGKEYHDADGRPVLDYSDEGDAEAIKAQLDRERAAENMRLIYVALTRAVQRCYLVVGMYTRKAGRSDSIAEASRSPLNSLVAGADVLPGDWPQNRLSAAEIHAAWQAYAAGLPDCVELAPLPVGNATRLEPVPIATDDLAALPAPAAIPRAWWIGSYSSLSHGARHEAAAVDHDARVVGSTDDEVAESGAGMDDILDFPRGPQAGNCIHAVFERADFNDPTSWPAAIAQALRDQPPVRGQATADASRPRMLLRMLGDVLGTTLPMGMTLAELPRARRLIELEFDIPAPHLSAHDLSLLLRRHGYPSPPLTFGVLEGYLRGFIDLVFEHAGCFYILDWKSNHLGPGPSSYAAESVGLAMEQHGYHLQYLLYAVALHRYLQTRLTGYRYEDHFGGAIYLFVRGVRPTWTGSDGLPTGMHADRPPRQLVEQLSALFEAQESVGAAA